MPKNKSTRHVILVSESIKSRNVAPVKANSVIPLNRLESINWLVHNTLVFHMANPASKATSSTTQTSKIIQVLVIE